MANSTPKYIEPPPRARLSEFAGTSFGEEEMSRADRAVAKVLEKYPTLLNDQVTKLMAAWGTTPEALDGAAVAPVFAVAHELAGLGETFGYPLVTILGRSLCRLLKTGDLHRERMTDVVDAHIGALNAVVRNRIQGHGGETGLALAAGLDTAITKFRLASGASGDTRLHDEVAVLQPKK